MAVVEASQQKHQEHQEHHGHGEFIAHHFEDAGQQYESGKLGIWVFLVTEVLFFAGLFVAYTLWRTNHPEIFQQAHVFLDKVLGGINTVVLLFSSLTMALGVRAAQLQNNRSTAVYVLITAVCAAVFLGVKAIEYSHKWDQGILVRAMWDYRTEHATPELNLAKQLNVSDWLITLSILPTLLLVAFIVVAVVMAAMSKPIWSKFFAGLAVIVGGYFLGAVGGQLYMTNLEPMIRQSGASGPPIVLHADDKSTGAGQATQAGGGQHGTESASADHGHDEQGLDAPSHDEHSAHNSHQPSPESLDRDVGIFFSIYYCMTGLHAFHILGGIFFLSWIYYRSLAGHWRSDYFGPVDFVGLYWHLVDLIWIFLFPLLYLID